MRQSRRVRCPTKATPLVDYDLLHRELAHLAADLGPASDLHEGLHRLTVTAAEGLRIAGAGVTLKIPEKETHYLTAADPITLHVERQQDALQEGACVDAINTSQVVTVPDLTVEQPWPRFTPVLLDAGFRAVAGVPVRFQGSNIGALNLYDARSRTWNSDDRNAARLVADVAAGYLVNNDLLRESQTVVEQLQFALDSRVIIEQAKGLMAGRHDITPEQAFGVMRTYARGRRIKLHEVAQAVVANGLDVVTAEEQTGSDGPDIGA